MKTNPKMFFRYQRFSEQTMAALCSDKVHFASPSTFNDPLDCQPSIECDSDLQSLRRLLELLIQRRVAHEVETALSAAHLTGPKAAAHSQKVAANSAKQALIDVAYHATNPDCGSSESENEAWLLTQEIEREFRRHYERGVCCFAATGLSPLLWSHYADHHKGLCVGYTADRLPRPVLRQAIYGGRRVVHTSTILRAIADQDGDARDCLEREMLLRKAQCWSYEKEWRLIGDVGIQNSPLLLKEITFGLRCPREVKHLVISALSDREPPVDFFEVSQVRGQFKLRRSWVGVDELADSFPKVAQSAEEVFGKHL